MNCFEGEARAATYMQTAVDAGEAVWSKGLLFKGPGLCHGISGKIPFIHVDYSFDDISILIVVGNGYVFLALYRATRDKRYLHRAVQFALAFLDPRYRDRMRSPDTYTFTSSLYR